MDRYIGLDAHSQTCTFAVMGPSGKRLREQVLETNGKVLVDFIKAIAGCRCTGVEVPETLRFVFRKLCGVNRRWGHHRPGARRQASAWS